MGVKSNRRLRYTFTGEVLRRGDLTNTVEICGDMQGPSMPVHVAGVGGEVGREWLWHPRPKLSIFLSKSWIRSGTVSYACNPSTLGGRSGQVA